MVSILNNLSFPYRKIPYCIVNKFKNTTSTRYFFVIFGVTSLHSSAVFFLPHLVATYSLLYLPKFPSNQFVVVIILSPPHSSVAFTLFYDCSRIPVGSEFAGIRFLWNPVIYPAFLLAYKSNTGKDFEKNHFQTYLWNICCSLH